MNKPNEITLHDLLVMKLQALYDVENVLVKSLPSMIKKSTDEDLRKSFEKNFEETKNHVKRLEAAFHHLAENPKKLKGEAIRGLIEDASWVPKNIKNSEALDAALIGAAQSVEHYEIAGYGTAVTWAETLRQGEVLKLLEETLAEEKASDGELGKLATEKINQRAHTGS